MSKPTKFLLAFAVFSLVVTLGQRATFAADPKCEVEKRMFDKNLFSDLLGIPLTTKDFVTSVATSAYSTVSGFGITETVNCGSYVASQLSLPTTGGIGYFYDCAGTDTAVCDQMLNSQPSGGTAGTDNWLASYSESRVAGTLLGAAYLTENFTMNEPLPANLAFYVNDTLSRVPIVNKTFAATQDYGHALLNSILGTWKVFRNLAYALMAIILLYTGIIIILRRKISSQLVVSVQYALPRIIIAIILITFSYPIGATIGSLGWTLFKSNWAIAESIFRDSFAGTAIADTLAQGGALRLWATMIPLISLTGTGPIFLLAIVAIVIIYLVAGLIFNFKAIIIYIKIILSILTAPLEFALGAVPGNDDKIKGWFMRMGKYTLTLFGMGIILPLGTIIAMFVALDYAVETAGVGVLLSMAMPIFIILYCFGIGIGMEKRIEDFMGTGQKKR